MSDERMPASRLAAVASIGMAAIGAVTGISTAVRIMVDARSGDLPSADAMIVFGAAVTAAGPCPELLDRLDHAAWLYTRGVAPLVVCCGGLSSGISESTEMKSQLIARGVPAEAVVVDDNGSTSRRALAAVSRLGRGRWRTFCLVSSPYHMHRLMKEADRRKLPVTAAPVPLIPLRSLVGSRAGWHRIAGRIAPFVREVLAIWWYSVPVRFSTIEVRKAGKAAFASGQLAAAIETTASEKKDGRSCSFEVPMVGPVISGFGWRSARNHDGIDIRARYGTEVRTTAPGVVAFAGKLPILGQVVAVHHDGRHSSVYGHLSSISVEPNAPLGSAQPIGRCGSSGNAFGPHLHFEIREFGVPVDPVSYLGFESRVAPQPSPESRLQSWSLRARWAFQRLSSVTRLDHLGGLRWFQPDARHRPESA